MGGRDVLFCLRRAKGEMDALSAKHTNPLTAELAAWPISPKNRMRSGLRGRPWREVRWNGCAGIERLKNGTDPDAGFRVVGAS